MKKLTVSPMLINPYKCRKCLREDFKKSMEFTKHLQKCKGSVSEITLLPPPLPRGKPDGKFVADLIEASVKAGELKALLDSLIKRAK